jgi:hypothetical protein
MAEKHVLTTQNVTNSSTSPLANKGNGMALALLNSC